MAAPDIKILSVESQLSNNILSIPADAEVNLAKDPVEALESGVPLFFDLHIEILRNRKYIWDRDLFKTKYTYSLQRHTLSKKYVLKNLITDTQQVHSSITAALQNLGQIKMFLYILFFHNNNHVYSIYHWILLASGYVPIHLQYY